MSEGVRRAEVISFLRTDVVNGFSGEGKNRFIIEGTKSKSDIVSDRGNTSSCICMYVCVCVCNIK